MKPENKKILCIFLVSALICCSFAVLLVTMLYGGFIRALYAMSLAWATMGVVFLVVSIVSWMFGVDVFENQ